MSKKVSYKSTEDQKLAVYFSNEFFYNFIDEIGSHLVNENKYESWVELHISLMLAGVIHIFSST